jgi:ATP-dependent helicase Lhr and Lhr-like helicase
MDTLAAIALKILDELQLQESRLLSWGMVDGSFTDDELIEVAERIVEVSDADVDPEDAIDWLEDQIFLFRLPEPVGRYRTRTAEGVRLFARLRQIFPGQSWSEAPELVADFRFATLPRRYPDRYIAVDDAVDQLDRDLSCSDLQKRIAYLLLGGEDARWKLADFQVDASARVLAEAQNDRTTATIVCSGTGSGKTLAFYLPAFMHISDRIDDDPQMQCLAIYPRTELLRDQLKTAIQNARSVDSALRERRGRPLSIGALYGSVPYRVSSLNDRWHKKSWPNVLCQGRSARRCPYLDCPDCNAPLGWLDDDIQEEKERLICSQCSVELGGDMLRLTRQSMSANPPDILFATTEMLNRGMANRALWPLLGIGDDVQAPSLVLLDEVHTYGGIHGAQVGLTLRRWRHLAQAEPHFVGLSATLAEAPRFMAELVGLSPSRVVLIEPRKLVTEGCEHIIALRGKPGTATLSTTIQSSMLLRRLLDADPPVTDGIAGKRIFVFTDNLDVTNRLYFQLADAEGWRNPSRRQQASHPPLASLRSSMGGGAAARFRNGQSWDVVEKIGHNLGAEGRSVVGRTSSQDASVDSNAEMVVATASLEVGFDDPSVGGIVQHQAPRDPAAYVQRKGRAGRSREMRPWTVVVLSDYGRDRLAYRSYEHLFSPDVPPRRLPIENRHVLRIQAALSFMDWLTKYTPASNLWRDLAQPGSGAGLRRQEEVERRVKRLLNDTQLRARFARHLKSSLGLKTADEALALLWEPPRSLVFSVWPTLLRRLEQQWQYADGSPEPHTGYPLPEYVPRTLFDDLNLPEVAIRLENRWAREQDDKKEAEEASMPIRQALSEFAPGRVSRRYGIDHALDSHWVPPPEQFVGPLDIETFCSREDANSLGTFQYVQNGSVVDVTVLRPYRIRTVAPNQEIHERSDARPHWHVQIVADGYGTSISLPRGSAWCSLFSDMRFHSHLNGNPIEMRRFTTGADVRIRESSPPMHVHEGVVTYRSMFDDIVGPAALGYSADVDGLVVDVSVPDNIRDVVTANPMLLRSVRIALFAEILRTMPDLDGTANVFQRRALADTYLAVVVILAEREAISLEQSCQRLANGEHQLLVEVLDILFPADSVVVDMGDATDDEEDFDDFRELATSEIVRAHINDAAKVLYRDLDLEDEPWLQRSAKATIGGAFLGACQRLCPQVDAGDLFVELSSGPTISGDLPPDQVWLTEATVGGTGFIEAIQREFAGDPRRFVHLFEAELEPADFEDVDHYLNILLDLLVQDSPNYDVELAEAFDELRSAETFAGQSSQFEALLAKLRSRGIATTHAVVSAMSLRLLRPGTNSETDRLTSMLVHRRGEVEVRYGIELDDRSCAALLAFDENVRDELRRAFPTLPQLEEPAACHALIMGLLWPRGADVRRQSLSFWNPFEDVVYCDRLLLHALIPHAPVTVSLQDKDWREQFDAALLQHGRAALVAPLAETELLRAATLDLTSEPIEADSLLLFPIVRAYKRQVGQAALVFDMPEALQ